MEKDRRKGRSRSRSPYKAGHAKGHSSSLSDRRRDRVRPNHESTQPKPLPLSAFPLSKHDLARYMPMFALYLDIQKQISIEDLDEREVKGRWKSFVNKWNRGDLAEGWYDPATLRKAQIAETEDNRPPFVEHDNTHDIGQTRLGNHNDDDNEDDDVDDRDEYGPALPRDVTVGADLTFSRTGQAGPTIPNTQEVRARREDERESRMIERDNAIAQSKHDRKLERKIQNERLDELAPRASAGTRERQLEKRREVAASNRTFAASKEAGVDLDLPESDVMGSDATMELRKMREREERKKNDRQLRQEETLRARRAEREERQKGLREKEEKTMTMLQELAKARFGSAN